MNQYNQTKLSTLSNGLRICAISFPGIKTVSIHSYIFVGSIYETRQNNGISHFVEHMLFRGNEKLGNSKTLNLKIEELGGETNASTSFEMTEYWLDFHRDYLNQGIYRFCSFLQYPLFEQIEIERSIILEEILDDYNENNQLINLDNLISNELWPEHPMGLPVIGNLETVKNINREDLVAWFKQYYQPQNIVIGVTGDFEVTEVLNIIEDEFKRSSVSTIKKHRPILPSIQKSNQIKLVHDNDNQFAIQWAFPQYDLDADLRIQYQIIRRILDNGYSSRLQRLIREEKGLVYDISAEMLYFDSGAVLFIESLVGINRFTELITALTSLINEMSKSGITQNELDLAKLRYKTDQDCERDTAQGTLYSTLWPIIYPTVYPFEKSTTMVNKISLEEINQTVQNMFIQNQTCFALVGPWTEQIEDLLKNALQPWIST